jgi:sulfopyruvate decarboxylase subunit alpha
MTLDHLVRAGRRQASAGDETAQGSAMLEAIRASGIEFIVALPDITTVQALLKPLVEAQAPRVVRVCKEAEGVGILAGLSYTDVRGLLLMQSTGLLDCINALRADACEYGLPICMMVGLIGKEPDRAPAASESVGVRIVEPILDAMGIRHVLIETKADVAKIQPAVETAYATSTPVALLIGRPPAAS